jgi:hypothetical protein
MNNELRNIISGTGEITARNLIQTALFYLRESKTTSGKIEESELVNKKNEIERLALLANQNHLWYQSINDSTYIGEGAEQKVYLNEDGKNVIKLNDTIFYSSWEEYFISLLIHNYLFVKTSYDLIGFYQQENTFYAVVKQPFIESTEATDLEKVRLFLESNGFKHKKNNDYFNTELGIILEDLHDENVLTNKGVFFFIDSAIYLL